MKNTREFLERLVNDKGFAKKFEGIKDLENLKKVAGGEGYDINLEEYKKIQAEALELSDEKLESAAGGVDWNKVQGDINGGMSTVFGTLASAIGGATQVAGQIASIAALFKK